ncbi:hypothetical protein K503DRAFT_78321 [Rhizopogon vinicolor AM-OR11-026]|uniref:Uncharacterized protein n=1 Tax=Rhizopogon vinicolor AM-OR11-026 TaxID=1314800 RepID=A0A1B7MFY5_9AGAM|nr:hypothetical protein K503DRAFT_78321 [Rhizopogon vinicolor AM-OR11-026]
MIPPPLTVESSQFGFPTQVGPSHGGYICYPIQPPTNRPYPTPIPLSSNPHPYLQYCYEPARNSLVSSSPGLLSCLWLLDGTSCGFTGSLQALRAHCESAHFFGPQSAQIECHWQGCDYHKRDDPTVHVMRRDCMWHHTREIHLG